MKNLYENKDKDAADYYYSVLYKKEYTKENYNRTRATVQYLIDSGFSLSEIFNEFRFHASNEIKGSELKTVYKDSLVKKGAFYLHKELRIEPPAPTFDIESGREIIHPYYLEIRPRYTKEDVLNYFLNNLNMINRKAIDINGTYVYIQYLMDRYKNIDYVEPLDVILCSIDNHLKQHGSCNRLIDVTQDNLEVIEQLVKDMMELEAQNKRRIIWRTLL